MNTGELVSKVAQNQDLSKAETRRLLDAIVQTMTEALAGEEGFTIPKLGTFEVQTHEKRRSYNPNSKQYMMLPPKKVVHFQPNQHLKETVK